MKHLVSLLAPLALLLPVVLSAVGCGNDVAIPDPPAATAPVYYGQVERILRDNCVDCHSSDPSRLAPFSLASFADAREAAESAPIAFSVMNRIMPPYYAKDDGTCQPIHASKWLSDDEIATLVNWVNGDRLEGDHAETVEPLPPSPGLAAIDRTVGMSDAYKPDSALDDDYRCFIVPALGADAFITGVHVRPSNQTVAHHVILFALADAAAETTVAQLDAASPGLGYPCTNGVGTEATSFLTGWAPGQGATRFPEGTGVAVAGARKMVLQIHYNLANSDGLPDRTQLDLDLETSVAAPAQFVAVRGDVNLPPREPDAIASGTRALALPAGLQSARVWGGMIHMHQRGIGAKVSIENAENTCLLDLDGWSFHWQHAYWYEAALRVNRGDVLKVTCHYDTTAETANVTWGESTDDEMCLGYMYISK